MLENAPPNTRGARWYYYSAVANSGIGNNVTALEHGVSDASPAAGERPQLVSESEPEFWLQRDAGHDVTGALLLFLSGESAVQLLLRRHKTLIGDA